MPKSKSPKPKQPATAPTDPYNIKLGPMFGGALEHEVRLKSLPDLVKPGLDVIFVGINPGLYSAHRGHYYAKKGNHFWPCLAQSGLVPVHFGPDNDADCLEYKIGLTDIVKRCTRAQSELTEAEFEAGTEILKQKLRDNQPLVVVFNGKQIYAKFTKSKLKDVKCGVKGKILEGCQSTFYVMSNSSALNAHYPTPESRMFYYEEIRGLLKELRVSSYFVK